MLFFHYDNISKAPTRMLLVAHMGLCKLRSREWGTPRAATWYYGLSRNCVAEYHRVLMVELTDRGVKIDMRWTNPLYIGSDKYKKPTRHTPTGLHEEYERRIVYSVEYELSRIQQWRDAHGCA